ncbi:amino acid transporter [Annulohypoxylon truncatum]|uniref:amino acid transporter n=1 Tax=Annulohypoxylon truncatum TaxID=327061 RepID=UPI00200842B6|nr:amino acid transporter [Annulohypoxylon truncatum]KAI1210100.1 amino acid transporter [Annulohypoxylon truncatum]
MMDIAGKSKESIELRVASQNNGDTLLSFSDFSGGNYHSSRDDTTLRRLGKRPLLNRSFGFMSSLGLSCTVLLSWEGILVTSVPTFLNNGPGGVIWAFLIGWVGVTSVYATVAELASIAPTAGGQYHWVAMMAPDSCANFLSYLTAWLTTLAWQVIAITTSYSVATIIQGIIVLARPTYVAIAWHTVLIMWAAAVFSVLVNSTTGRALAKFEGAVLILHLAGFFGVLVPLVYFAPHNTPAEVFTTFSNNGGWPTQGVAFLVGVPTVASTLTGADCAVHMSEEVRQANVVVPRALIYTIFINGALGFAMVIALLFCISDVPAAVAAADTMFYPFLQIFESAVKSTTGACIMAGVVLVLAVASSISTYASASRMMWSFARDKGLPFDSYLVKLNKNSLPVYAIICTMAITVLISLIVLGSSVVLSALLSLLLAAIYSSYLLACGLLLWRRCTGAFQPYVAGADEDPRNADQLFWGPWKLPEPFGTINNAFACVYTLFLLFWSFWPQSNNPDPEELNWSVVVYGAVLVFSVVWYVVRARHHFKGPIREV